MCYMSLYLSGLLFWFVVERAPSTVPRTFHSTVSARHDKMQRCIALHLHFIVLSCVVLYAFCLCGNAIEAQHTAMCTFVVFISCITQTSLGNWRSFDGSHMLSWFNDNP